MTGPAQPSSPGLSDQAIRDRSNQMSTRVSGKVVMENGAPPPESVRIDTVCGGRISTLTYTDSKGGFSGQSGMPGFSDARTGTSSRPTSPRLSGIQTQGNFCSLRANLPGYRSTEINLALLANSFDPVTIVLHPAAGVEGRTISATTLEAPKDARAAYEKASRGLRDRKWDAARTQLEKAVQLYPRYAIAWSALGKANSQLGRTEEARKAWQQATIIDPKFVDPYFGLAEIAMHEQKWQEMAELTGTLVKLDPYDFPGAWAYDAMARLNLNQLDAAEKSARQGVRIDEQHEVPKNEHLLGVILMRKGDYEGAVAHMNKYLDAVPDASDADFVRKQMAACTERARGDRAAADRAAQPKP